MRHNIFSILTMAMVAAGCQTYDAPYNPQPTLSVANATEITRMDATVTGTVTGTLPELHFEWWQDNGVVSYSPSLSDENGKVKYSLHGLKPGCNYSYRLNGSNGRVVIMSETRHFQTLPNIVPAISGLTPLAKGPASVIASFQIEDNGGESIIEAGCHVRNINTGNMTKYIADISNLSDSSDQSGTTIYITIRGLEKNADLEFTPYAANSIGETKGTPLVITTGNSIFVSEAGMLAKVFGNDRMDYTSLSFAGIMNGDDIRVLREMAGKDFQGVETAGRLADIDLTDVSFVEGGSNYIPSRYMTNDVAGYGMFQNLDRLKSVKLPNTVRTIEEQAFQNCSSLTFITIPAAAESVNPSSGCTAFEEIRVSMANRNYKSEDGVLFNADVTAILWFPMGKTGEYSLPTSVTAIGDYTFRNSNLTHFVMGNNVTQIGRAVFSGSSIRSVILSDNLATIPQASFQSCKNLTEVRLGSTTNLIGSFAFDGCPLTDIYLSAKIPPVCNAETFNSSYDLLKLCRLHVPEQSIARYRHHPVWGMFENISR